MKKITILLFVTLTLFTNILFAQHLKKDGTPDMRYKENKVNYSPPSSSTSNYNTPSTSNYDNSGHLKKDGTPDMKYKENKESYSPPTSSSSNYTIPPSTNIYNSNSETHFKDDGTPDRRFKENKTSSSSNSQTSITVPKYYKTKTSAPKFYSNPNYNYSVERDAHGKIKRSEAAKLAFMKESNFPHGRPGYVVDHIVPLKKGGCDCPRNMQWQTIVEAKAKDKWE